MTVNAAVFTCSICAEPSTEICAFCTKDACANHRCIRCKRCSDCCECEYPLSAEEVQVEEPVSMVPEPVHSAEAGPLAESMEEPLAPSEPGEPPFLHDSSTEPEA